MGLLSPEMLAEFQRPNPNVFPLASITFPSMTGRYGANDVSVLGIGTYLGKVLSWGTFIRSISDRDGRLATPQTGLVIADLDNVFAQLIEGSSGNAIRGSIARITIVSPKVPSAKWWTLFTGILGAWRMDPPTSWDLTFQFRDQSLRGKVPRTAFLASDWPNADATIYGKFAPSVYGIHDSTGSTGTGMIPGFLVDKGGGTNPVYAFAHGWLLSVDRVFSNGSLQTSNYTVQHPTTNGRVWTTVKFTSSPPAASAVVTADVHGYEAIGNGTGSLITGSDQLQHFLENRVFRDHPGGGWFSPGTYTSAAAFATAAAYCRQLGILTSRWIGGSEQTTGLAEIARFLQTTQLFAFWTNSGLIAVLPNDPRDPTVYYDDPKWVFEGRGDTLVAGGGKDSFRVDFDRDSVSDQINAQYLHSAAAGAYQRQIEVRDLALQEGVADALEMIWSQSA